MSEILPYHPPVEDSPGHHPGEILKTEATGAVRFNGGKADMSLVPPEVLKLFMPESFHWFVDWFHSSDALEADHIVEALRLCGARLPLERGQGALAEDLDALLGLLAASNVYTVSASEYGGKYPARNWEKGLKFSGLFSSAIRHVVKIPIGTCDDESKQPHLAHFAWGVIACYVFQKRGRTDLDDRPAVLAVK